MKSMIAGLCIIAICAFTIMTGVLAAGVVNGLWLRFNWYVLGIRPLIYRASVHAHTLDDCGREAIRGHLKQHPGATAAERSIVETEARKAADFAIGTYVANYEVMG